MRARNKNIIVKNKYASALFIQTRRPGTLARCHERTHNAIPSTRYGRRRRARSPLGMAMPAGAGAIAPRALRSATVARADQRTGEIVIGIFSVKAPLQPIDASLASPPNTTCLATASPPT